MCTHCLIIEWAVAPGVVPSDRMEVHGWRCMASPAPLLPGDRWCDAAACVHKLFKFIQADLQYA